MADTNSLSPLTDEEYEALKAKYGRCTRVMTPAGELVFRAPSSAEENAFQMARFGGTGHIGMAWRNLQATIVVRPDLARFTQIVATWPAININPAVTRALMILRGEVNEDEVK